MHRSHNGSMQSISSSSSKFSSQFEDSPKLIPYSLIIPDPERFLQEPQSTSRRNKRSQPKDQKGSKTYKFDLANFPGTSSEKSINRKESAKLNESILKPCTLKVKIELASCFMWFLVTHKATGDVLPDYELGYCKRVFKEMIAKQPLCHEALFGLAKLWFHDNKHQKAIENLEQAVRLSNDVLYKKWLSILQIKNSCKTAPEALTCKERVQAFFKGLPNEIESLWCMFEISLGGQLQIGKEIESPVNYALKIKIMDNYYGYLAWSRVFMHENQVPKAIKTLIQLIESNPSRPEAYILLWQHLYYREKHYAFAEEIAEKAYLNVQNSNYSVLIAINYAKTFFRLNKYRQSFELLQKKYLQNTMNTVFLYQYGKLCTKSEDLTFLGSAIGSLQECLLISRKNRMGCIYYWLAKAYLLSRQLIEAIGAMKKALNTLPSSEVSKKNELKSKLREFSLLVSNLEVVDKLLKSEKTQEGLDHCLQICQEIRNFQKPAGEVLVCRTLVKLHRTQEALNRLKTLASNTLGYLEAYFVLFELGKNLENLKEIGKEMVKKCSNLQIPAPLKVKAYIKYSKVLAQNGKPAKAILMLKSLAKILPFFPLENLPYTNELRLARSDFEMSLATIKAMSSGLYCEIEDTDEMGMVIHENTKKSLVTHKFSSEDLDKESHRFKSVVQKSPKLRRFTNLSIETQKKNKFIGNLADILENLGQNEEITGEKADPEFGVNSEVEFLYLIGKFSLKYRVGLKDGFCALQDYLNVTKFQKVSEEKNIKTYKALCVKVWILVMIGKIELANEIMVEIYPKLVKFNLHKQAAKVKMHLTETGYFHFD